MHRPTDTRPDAPADVDRAATLTGRVLGDFTVLGKLGEGGVGAAYLAKQTLLGREAVVKVLLAGAQADESTQSRFLREARLASRVEHPYAVQVFAFGAEPDGLLWIAMELVRGTSLSDWIKTKGPIPLSRFAPFFDALCDTVEAVHDKGIVHRDIKPSNVMVTVRNGRLYPKLLDLGIATMIQSERQLGPFDALAEPNDPAKTARSLESTASMVMLMNTGLSPNLRPYEPIDTPVVAMPQPAESASPSSTLTRIELAERLSVTRDTDAVGSPLYMAPEQWLSSRDVTGKADIYSLGILAWQTLTGQLPFIAKNTTEIAMAHLRAPLPLLPDGFPEGLQALLHRAMSKNPEKRFAKAGDFGRAVAALTAQNQRMLPSLPDALRQEWVDAAPQPLAEIVASLETVKSMKEAFDAARRLSALLPRYLGLLALLCRQRLGPASPADEASLAPLVATLRKGRLEHHGWLELLWSAVAPWATRRDQYPVPGFIDFCLAPTGAHKSEAFKTLESLELQLDGVEADDETMLSRFEEVVAKLSSVLHDASFVLKLPVVRATADPGLFQNYSGVRRVGRAPVRARLPSAIEGDLYLLDPVFTPILRLHPLMQMLEPSPGEGEEFFLFRGAGRHGARLVSAPREFERQDEATWAWFDSIWPHAEAGDENSEGQQKAPYKGLASFTAADAQDFFGREVEAQAVANRLRVKPFLAVVGPSGVGKSSFVQAGVAPLLADALQLIVVRPGNTPMATLMAKLQALGMSTEGLETALAKDSEALSQALVAFAERDHKRYLLVVDQFEELLTLCPSAQERERYAAALVAVSSNDSGRAKVVVTLRDDFLIRAQSLEALKRHLSTGLHLLGTPGESELLRILTEPLKRLGYAFEDPDLPKQMVNEVMQQPGALALLSFSATRLWDARDTHFRRLTRRAYQTMGGVGGALAGHAEETLASMPEEERLLTREAFRHLVSSSGTRAVLTRAEALELLGNTAAGAHVLDRLIDARLLVTSEGGGGDDRVEIIHEALLLSWPRLVQWQRENAELARMRDNLRAAARQWHEQKRPRGMLWRDEVLTEYRVWRPKYPGALTAIEQAFAAASVGEFERGRRIRRGLLIAAFVVLSVGLVILYRANLRAEENALKASASAAESAHRLTLMTAEQGRVAFLANRPAEALALLSTAADAGLDTPGLRSMLTKSKRALETRRHEVDVGTNITKLGLSHNGSTLAVGMVNGSVSLYDAKTMKLVSTLSVAKRSLRGLEFSADDSRLAICGAEGTLSLWNPLTQARFDTLQVDSSTVFACPFSPDGKQVFAGGEAAQLHRISIDGDALKARTTTASFGLATLGAIRFSPDGKQFIGCANESGGPPLPVKRWPLESVDGGPIVWLEKLKGPVRAAAWSRDGRTLFTGDETSIITTWDAVTGKKKQELAGHRSAVVGLATSPDGKTLFSAGGDGVIKLWDTATNTSIASLPAHEGTFHDFLVPPGTELLVTSGVDSVIRVWSMSGQLRTTLPPQPGGISALIVDVPNDQIVVATIDGIFRTFRLSVTDFEQSLPVAADTVWVGFDGTEQRLFAGHNSGPIVEMAVDGARPPVELKTKLLDDRVFSISLDGKRIITDRDGTVELLDTEGRVVRQFKGHAGGEFTVSFSADEKQLLVVGNYQRPFVYDVDSGAERPWQETDTPRSGAGAFARRTNDVWFGTVDGEVVVWPAEGKVRRKKISRTVTVGIAVSPDDRLVVVSTFDQKVHVLRTDTLEEIGVTDAKMSVTSLVFSPDSTRFVAADTTAHVEVFSLSPFEMIESRQAGRKLVQLVGLLKQDAYLTLTTDGLLLWSL